MISPRDESLTDTSSLPHFPRSSTKRILFVFGTRPEAIKLCPLISAFSRSALPDFEPISCVTGQHREMLDQVLTAFDIKPDFNLESMISGQSLNGLTARLFDGLTSVLDRVQPAMTIVQGDTTTTLCGALASFHAQIPVAHVEAGLRTSDLRSPFPEEMNRVVTDRLASLHFAATRWAADNLLREGCDPKHVWVTGNTGIDAVLSVRAALERGDVSGLSLPSDEDKRLILVTAHRRESFGKNFEELCEAVAALANRDDIQIVWPVHLNPNVQGVVKRILSGKPNVLLTEPLEYLPFVDLMRRSYLLMTDSGGVQEEAPSLGKPVLVLREKTERPEAVEAGTVRLVGTDRRTIISEATRLLDDGFEYSRMSRLHNPYGDGRASERIIKHIRSYFVP